MNLKTLLAAFCIAGVSACSVICEDDDAPQDTAQTLFTGNVVGTWKTVALYEYDGDHVPLGCTQPDTPNQDVVFTFYSDNTFTVEHNCNEALPYNEGTYTTDGHVLTLTMGNGELKETAHMTDTDENSNTLAFRFFGIGSDQAMLGGYKLEVQKI